MHGSAQPSLRRPADRHSDDEWEEAMLNDALNNSLVHSAPGRRERWFDFCFRFIILVLAGLWLFVPPADKGRTQPDVKAAATQR